MSLLSDVRAFVGAESAYSKAQKQSTYYLNRYATSHEEIDYQQFLHAIAIPLADHSARLSLEQQTPDYEVAKAYFVKAKNHPDDVEGMMKLFVRFRHTSLMREPIAIWTQADIYVDQLKLAGEELHTLIVKGRKDETDESRLLLEKIHAINSGLSPLEDAFSNTLGTTSREARYIIDNCRLAITISLMIVGILLTRRIILKNVKATNELLESEIRLRSVLDTSMDAVVQMNQDGFIIGWSGQAVNMFGWNVDEALGKTMHEMIIPPQLRDAHSKGMARFISTGEAKILNSRIEILALRRDGSEFPVELTISHTAMRVNTSSRPLYVILRNEKFPQNNYSIWHILTRLPICLIEYCSMTV